MLSLLQEGASFQLIYADTTFCSQRDYFTKDGRLAYSDKWDSPQQWLDSLRGSLSLAWELLTDDGCLVVHCDHRGSHLIRGLLDEVFGWQAFASEIVWRYRRWPVKCENYQKVHDTLLRYVKNPRKRPRWTQLYEPLSPSTLRVWGDKRKQKAFAKDGVRIKSVLTEEVSLGALMGDVWDISILAPIAKERTGYPTQKPEELLERLILSLTRSGDNVLDPYMGSGTTLAVAKRLGRNGVGIDESKVAISIATKRLSEV